MNDDLKGIDSTVGVSRVGKSNTAAKDSGDHKSSESKKHNTSEQKDVEKSDAKNTESNSDDEKEKDTASNDKNNEMSKAVKTAGTTHTGVQSAQTAYGLMRLMAYLRMLQQLMATLVQAALGFFGKIAAFATNVWTGFTGFCSSVASFFGTSATVVTSVISGGVILGAVTAVGTVYSVHNSNEIARTDAKATYDCSAGMGYINDGATIGNISAEKMQNAQLIYSTLKHVGLADYNIAGLLGNWDAESGLDPTAVETIYDEPFQLGPRKQAAEANGFDINKINGKYGSHYVNIKLCGIGLGQWTNGRNTMLRNYAAAANLNWYDLSAQLAFAIAPASSGGDSSSAWLLAWAPEATPESAANTFCQKWEGISPQEKRAVAAAAYATEIVAWQVDEDYAKSIIKMTGDVQATATDIAADAVITQCNKGKVVKANNTSIANAAVYIAYENQDLGRGNNGTEMYKTVHKGVLPGDSYYQSCDRTVATAVRWSGADDSYPAGPVSTQLSYLIRNTEKWQEIEWGGDKTQLQPGDILIKYSGGRSHTLIYTGHEAIAKKYPNAQASYEVVSGSLNERSPGCGAWYREYNSYRIFRNIKKEVDSKYTHVGMSSSKTKS